MNETQNTIMPEIFRRGLGLIWGPLVFSEHARLHTLVAIESLAQDLKRNGQLQNIVVSKEADPTSPTGWRYEVVVGRGRVEAARASWGGKRSGRMLSPGCPKVRS